MFELLTIKGLLVERLSVVVKKLGVGTLSWLVLMGVMPHELETSAP